jgi:hypothetical protein
VVILVFQKFVLPARFKQMRLVVRMMARARALVRPMDRHGEVTDLALARLVTPALPAPLVRLDILKAEILVWPMCVHHQLFNPILPVARAMVRARALVPPTGPRGEITVPVVVLPVTPARVARVVLPDIILTAPLA